MSEQWELRVYDQKQLVHQTELTGAAELGRQQSETEPIFRCLRVDGRQRVVIAALEDQTVSRRHLLIEPQPDCFRLTNLSEKQLIGLPDESMILKPKASRLASGDVLLTLGSKSVRLRHVNPLNQQLQRLSEATIPPGTRAQPVGTLSLMTGGWAAGSVDPREALRWLQQALDMLQSATSPADFFASAAQALIELGNFDSSRVLLWQQGEWQPQAHAASSPRTRQDSSFSRSVLTRVQEEKRTFWQAPGSVLSDSPSMAAIESMVAAPILDRQGAVIGALYGERRLSGLSRGQPVTELEAMLVEVLARGVAAGLARLEQEQALLAARVQFEQFFTPKLARQLERNPGLLQGRDTEVSVLFCDIRGFSRITEHLGPARTLEWIGAVLEALSDCVQAHGGVLVDYIGDELMALWGAPEDQPDHARLACQAALDMLGKLPLLDKDWQETLKEPMGLGIGVNTGTARVGNTGSRFKFKYGALGNTVNLASRVQGATKHLKCRLLITEATRARLDDRFATRRLCQVQVVNIAGPVTLHELAPADQPDWAEAKQVYEQALAEFEARNFGTAARILAPGVPDSRRTPRPCCCCIARSSVRSKALASSTPSGCCPGSNALSFRECGLQAG